MASQSYSTLVRYKRWADLGLYDTVARNFDKLSAEDAAIIPLVLDHIHVVDRIFQHHLQGLPHGFHAPRSEETPSVERLAQATKDLDDWYVAYVDGLSAPDFAQPVDFVFTSGKAARMTRGEIILHVCLHGTYHRGNAGILLQKSGSSLYKDAVTDFLDAAA